MPFSTPSFFLDIVIYLIYYENVETKKKKININKSKARFKRRTSHVPNLMQMRKIYCFPSFALDSAHVKFDV